MRLNIILIVFIFSINFTRAQKIPEVEKTMFSESALAHSVTDTLGGKISVKEILNKYKGKVIVFKFWAGWCRDCLTNMELSHKLEENNPEAIFVYLSLDRTEEAWKKGITKYNLVTIDNYWFDSGWKNNFNNYIDLNWIPRYMIIDQKGDIAKYYAISAEDIYMQETLKKLME